MPRMSKNHPMPVSLKKGDQFRPAEFVWDKDQSAYFLRDTVAKKRFGPYQNVGEAKKDNEFHADMGRRALAV